MRPDWTLSLRYEQAFCFKFNQLFMILLKILQRSAIEQDIILIDNDTKEMLESINFKDLAGVQVQENKA